MTWTSMSWGIWGLIELNEIENNAKLWKTIHCVVSSLISVSSFKSNCSLWQFWQNVNPHIRYAISWIYFNAMCKRWNTATDQGSVCPSTYFFSLLLIHLIDSCLYSQIFVALSSTEGVRRSCLSVFFSRFLPLRPQIAVIMWRIAVVMANQSLACGGNHDKRIKSWGKLRAYVCVCGPPRLL